MAGMGMMMPLLQTGLGLMSRSQRQPDATAMGGGMGGGMGGLGSLMQNPQMMQQLAALFGPDQQELMAAKYKNMQAYPQLGRALLGSGGWPAASGGPQATAPMMRPAGLPGSVYGGGMPLGAWGMY